MDDAQPQESHDDNGKYNGDGKNGPKGLAPRDPRRANHLKPYKWKKGQSGCPQGPGKQPAYFSKAYSDLLKTSIPEQIFADNKTANSEALRVAIQEMVSRGARIVDFVALAQIVRAMKGDTRAAAEIADRVDGKALQQMRVEAVDASADKRFDFSNLSTEEIETMIGLYKKAALEPPAHNPA